MHGKCRQGDASIGETDHKSDGTYLNDHLEPWIQENGGWDSFVKLCENNTATKSQKGQERSNHWSLMGMTLAGIALLGSLFNS